MDDFFLEPGFENGPFGGGNRVAVDDGLVHTLIPLIDESNLDGWECSVVLCAVGFSEGFSDISPVFDVVWSVVGNL